MLTFKLFTGFDTSVPARVQPKTPHAKSAVGFPIAAVLSLWSKRTPPPTERRSEDMNTERTQQGGARANAGYSPGKVLK
jgi:hypothetical protein